MRKTTNQMRAEGRLFSHSLKERKVENKESKNYGQSFISGAINIAIDNADTNIVTVNYTYVSPTTSKGEANKTYEALKRIITENKTVENVGHDQAFIVKVSSAIAVNDFYTEREGKETLVSAIRNEGGFVTIGGQLSPDENQRSSFSVDMFIENIKEMPVEDGDDYIIIEGYAFNFKGDLLPVHFPVRSKDGISYFKGLGISKSNPTFRNVGGVVKSTRTVTTSENSENVAFGTPQVREYVNTRREWLVTTASTNDFEIGDSETGVTKDELKAKAADREAHLANVKANYEAYKKNKGAAGVTAPTNGSFDF